MTGKVIIDKLAVDFEILDLFRMIGSKLTPISYADHLELRFLAKEMTSNEVPSGDKWKTIEKFGTMKYKLHQWRPSSRTLKKRIYQSPLQCGIKDYLVFKDI